MDNPFAGVFGTKPEESKPEPKPVTPEDVTKVLKEVAEDEASHEAKHAELLARMNELADGRLEADIPLDDLYWDARNKAVQHHVSKG